MADEEDIRTKNLLLQQQCEALQQQLQLHIQQQQPFPEQSFAHVDRVVVRLPPFWSDNPSLWIAQVESQFALHRITSDVSKFNIIISQLEPRYAAEISDIITNPPAEGKFEKLKTELVSRISASREERIRQLLTQAEIGDRKPSQFLRYMRGLVGTETIPDTLLRTLWSGRLPSTIQTIIATQQNLPLDVIADLADKVFEVIPAPQVATVSTCTTDMNKRLDELSQQVNALTAKIEKLGHERSRFRSRSRPPKENVFRHRSPSQQPRPTTEGICWYHRRYGTEARKCTTPCEFSPNAPGSHP